MDRASRAAAFAEQLLDATLQAHVTGQVECARGCDHCCKTYVSATIPEILNLARAVRGQTAKTARVTNLAAHSRAMPQLHREAARLSCPMLEDRACSEYLARPMVCRAVLSKSLATCLKIFQHNINAPFEAADHSGAVRMFCVIILRAGLILGGLPHQHYEMNHALEIALADEHAEARWLAGESVFAGVAVDLADADPSPLSKIVDGMVNALRPTL
jgi:Fe-S-cluster containining protein